MNIQDPILIIEINNTNYIFVAGKYDESKNFNIIEKIIVPSNGIEENKFTDIDKASDEIKKNVEIIETKLNFVFKHVISIIDNFDFTSLNVSGYKKLNGSQILKENIIYILNSLKKEIMQNQGQKTILHIFNSKSILDGTNIENLPIGLFGDFYSHELSFFLIGNNDFRNIKQIFKKNNLDVKKIFLKSFSEGTQLINQNKVQTFYKININKDTSSICFFDHASYRYSENFNFGTNIILKDISKICSIDNEMIINFLIDGFDMSNNSKNSEYIEEKFFKKKKYRKIRKNLILDIVNARIDEISKIILNKNVNIKSFNKNIKIFIFIQDILILNNFKNNIKNYFTNGANSELITVNNLDADKSIINTANLSITGWKKEAIPVTQQKNSLVARIFQSIFG